MDLTRAEPGTMSRFQENAPVLEHEKVALQTYRLRLRAPGIARLARAGQFVMARVRQGTDPLLRRPFSFHRILREEGIIELLYRVVGRGTWWLSQVRPGETLSLIGPLGNGFQLPEPLHLPIALIAGGIGIAPLYQLILDLVACTGEKERSSVHLFYGARTSGELLREGTFQETGISLHLCTDDGSLGYGGRVTEMFQEKAAAESAKPAVVFSCGPLAMQYHLAKWVTAHGTDSQLSLEALMACGVGACLGCALPAVSPDVSGTDHFVHVCKQGPIFKAESIEWTRLQPHPASPPTFLYS
jgi:dihydroorotate dehydrogenase electron transfer subunit